MRPARPSPRTSSLLSSWGATSSEPPVVEPPGQRPGGRRGRPRADAVSGRHASLRARSCTTARRRGRRRRRGSRAGGRARAGGGSAPPGRPPARGPPRPARCGGSRPRPARAGPGPRSRDAGWAWTSSASGTPRCSESRTSEPTTEWAWRNGMPRSTSHSARSTAAAAGPSAASRMRVGVEVAGPEHPRHGRQGPA